MPISKTKKANYFVWPDIFSITGVTLGMGLTVLCTFKPDVVPYSYLGPIGQLANFLAYQQPIVMHTICYTALFMHVFEGCYAYYLAGMKEISGFARIKWFISTSWFGIFSLYHLLKFNPRKAQRGQKNN